VSGWGTLAEDHKDWSHVLRSVEVPLFSDDGKFWIVTIKHFEEITPK